MSRCPDEDALFAAAFGDAEPAVGEHLRGCEACRERTARLRDGRASWGALGGALAAPRSGSELPAFLGRFMIAGRMRATPDETLLRGAHLVLRQDCVLLLADAPTPPAARNEVAARARKLIALRHPAAADVLDLFFHEERAVVVEAFVAGATIVDHLAGQALAARELAALFLPVVEVLAAAHAAGLVHGTIEPAAIRVGADSGARLTGLGGAALRVFSDSGAAADVKALAGVIRRHSGAPGPDRKVEAALALAENGTSAADFAARLRRI